VTASVTPSVTSESWEGCPDQVTIRAHRELNHRPNRHFRHTDLRMSSDLPLQIGETLQSLSINRNPSTTHDINPSTAASEKIPVTVEETTLDAESYSSSLAGSDIDDEEEYSYNIIRPARRRQSLPPLPDLRFEQSYLASIADAETYQMVAYITIRDQVCCYCGFKIPGLRVITC
jgi:hypothetical protein